MAPWKIFHWWESFVVSPWSALIHQAMSLRQSTVCSRDKRESTIWSDSLRPTWPLKIARTVREGCSSANAWFSAKYLSSIRGIAFWKFYSYFNLYKFILNMIQKIRRNSPDMNYNRKTLLNFDTGGVTNLGFGAVVFRSIIIFTRRVPINQRLSLTRMRIYGSGVGMRDGRRRPKTPTRNKKAQQNHAYQNHENYAAKNKFLNL